MPTYEYRCTSCGESLEVVQRFADEPLRECPICGGHLRKLFSPVGVVFKGSGFYKTDSRGSGKKTATPAAKGDSATSTGSTSSSSSESKSATSGDGKSKGSADKVA